MNKFLLSSDELTECIERYGVLSDALINDLNIIKRIKQQSDKNTRIFEQISMIEQEIKTQINNIDVLRSLLNESLKKYIDTELDIFSHIQKKLFINFGHNSMSDVIVERDCEFSGSMQLRNNTLQHEEWLDEFVSEDKKL